ncbi:MAG: tryptophan-rich sensory protein [Alphaproteobacteria bacterium]|nr:tryptophan-rich sensory protein [Alphaproteobacteria bacterium]
MNMIASAWQLRASFLRWSLFLVPLLILCGALSNHLSGSGADSAWFRALEMPAIYPPGWLFGMVWTILYALMGFAMAVIAAAKGARGRGVAALAFVVQLALNLAWSPLFFAAHQITGALVLIVLLDVAVIVTIALFWRIRKSAALLMLPYLAWILFATLLTLEIRQANPYLDGQRNYSGAIERYEF